MPFDSAASPASLPPADGGRSRGQALDPDPEQARQQAAAAGAAADRMGAITDRGRVAFALGLALSGLVFGVYLIVVTAVDPRGAMALAVLGGYLVITAAVFAWQRRAARSVPLGANRIGERSLGTTVLIALISVVAVTAVGGLTGQRHQPIPLWLAVLLAVLSASPTLIGAWRVWRLPR